MFFSLAARVDEDGSKPLGSRPVSSRKVGGVDSLGELGRDVRRLCLAFNNELGALNENWVEGKDAGAVGPDCDESSIL